LGEKEVLAVRILIAEDETIIRLDLRALLERAGYDVCAEARDGMEAVELALTSEPDLAVIDVKMPRLDGVEAARRILAARPIPIVMLTAFSHRGLVTEAIDAGAFAYVVKPFRPQDLLPAIETAAARHEELLRTRRELGRKPPERTVPLRLVIEGSEGNRWPLLIGPAKSGRVEVTLAPDEPA
jgi:response regulator NasT